MQKNFFVWIFLTVVSLINVVAVPAEGGDPMGRRRFFALAVVVVVPASAHASISGTVYDGATQQPIAGAIVTQQATAVRDTTASNGTYSLPSVGTNLVITAAHEGYYTGSTEASSPAIGADILLENVPPSDDPAYDFLSPETCGMCHPAQLDQWTSSPMANAGINTWVYDLYDGSGTPGGLGGFVYTRDSELADTNPASDCASCHQPEPWVQSPFRALEDFGSLTEGALHGVSCEICHKIAHVDETRMNYPGVYPGFVTLTRPDHMTQQQVQYGVLGDADFAIPSLMRGSYQPQLVAQTCGACHQDKNDPDEDGDFEEENGVVSEPTFVEWLESPYGNPSSPLYETCAHCHMPSYGATSACTILDPPLVRDPETIRQHRIEGTTPAYLDNAASLSLECALDANEIDARVIIVNDRTGHHVPTGVTVRNMILLVDAWREEDGEPLTHLGTQTVHDLGGIGDPLQGYYAGLPGKLYAKVAHDAGGAGPVFFTEATGILFDNRIPALAADTTRFRFAVPSGGGTLRVRARLLYRRTFRALIDAKAWTSDGHGAPLEDIAAPHFGHLMEMTEWSSGVLAVAGTEPAAPAPRVQILPCPARAGSPIRILAPGLLPARGSVYDPAGRLVWSFGDHAAGREPVLVWDGRDRGGAPVASGVYVLRLSSRKGETLVQRFVIAR